MPAAMATCYAVPTFLFTCYGAIVTYYYGLNVMLNCYGYPLWLHAIDYGDWSYSYPLWLTAMVNWFGKYAMDKYYGTIVTCYSYLLLAMRIKLKNSLNILILCW